MARPPAFEKKKQDPSDLLDYEINWRSKELPFLTTSEVIVSSTWTAYDTTWVETDNVTIDDPTSSHTDTTTKVWVSEGVLGGPYYITNHIVTDEGREKDNTFSMTIEEQ